MHVEFLIIGQGICGSFLSVELKKAGRSFLVLDEEQSSSASRVASGIINPVTGRRIVKTWMIDELLPFAKAAYASLSTEAGMPLIRQLSTLDFFPTPQMLLAFRKRFEETADYLFIPAEDNRWRNIFNYDFSYGVIDPCFLIDIGSLLSFIRNQLHDARLLLPETFHQSSLQLTNDGISYKDIRADKIIFCDGISSMVNPFFKLLPFAPNKGELLIAEISELPRDFLYKYGLTFVPWQEDLFWIGASHEWNFSTDQPTTEFRERTVAQLKRLLKLPFKIVDHLAAVRPATLERRPFIGLHPLHQQVGIFNGMGTKGCSLAPYFAQQFADFLLNGKTLAPEVDINRFSNMLNKM